MGWRQKTPGLRKPQAERHRANPVRVPYVACERLIQLLAVAHARRAARRRSVDRGRHGPAWPTQARTQALIKAASSGPEGRGKLGVLLVDVASCCQSINQQQCSHPCMEVGLQRACCAWAGVTP